MRVHGISGLVEATGERFDVDDAGIICKVEYVERSEEDDLPFLIEWQHPDVDRRPVGSGNEDAKLFVENPTPSVGSVENRFIEHRGYPQCRLLRDKTLPEHPDFDTYDEGRLSERIMLVADAHGLGSAIGWFKDAASEEAKRILGVPQERLLRTIDEGLARLRREQRLLPMLQRHQAPG